eukprot:gene9642-32224_t
MADGNPYGYAPANTIMNGATSEDAATASDAAARQGSMSTREVLLSGIFGSIAAVLLVMGVLQYAQNKKREASPGYAGDLEDSSDDPEGGKSPSTSPGSSPPYQPGYEGAAAVGGGGLPTNFRPGGRSNSYNSTVNVNANSTQHLPFAVVNNAMDGEQYFSGSSSADILSNGMSGSSSPLHNAETAFPSTSPLHNAETAFPSTSFGAVLDMPLPLHITELAGSGGPAAAGGAAFGGIIPGGAFSGVPIGMAAAAAAAGGGGNSSTDFSDSGQEFDAGEFALMRPLDLPDMPLGGSSAGNAGASGIKSEPSLLMQQQQQQLHIQQQQMMHMQHMQLQQQQQYLQLHQRQQALQQHQMQFQLEQKVKQEPMLDHFDHSDQGVPNCPPGERPHKEGSRWAVWVLDMKVKQRNTLAQNRGFTKNELADLKRETKRHQRARAQQRYHKKRALAAGKSYSRPGRPRLEDTPLSPPEREGGKSKSGSGSGSGFETGGTSSDQEMGGVGSGSGGGSGAVMATVLNVNNIDMYSDA